MDETEMRRLFYYLLVGTDDAARKDAMARLSGAGENQLLLAQVAASIAKAINGTMEPKGIENEIGRLWNLPASDCWRGFSEVAAQALIARGLSMATGKDARTEIIRQGLITACIAQNGGFPLSKKTLELAGRARDEGGEIKPLAEDVLRFSGFFIPDILERNTFGKKDAPQPLDSQKQGRKKNSAG